MSTLADLRTTLEHHASFDDVEHGARPLAVRRRVRTARRRRAGAVAGAAVVTLVAATALVAAVQGTPAPTPAGPTLGQVDLPQQVDVHGFPYALAGTYRAARDGRVTVGDLDGPHVATLVATGLGTGTATLWSGVAPVARVREGEQVSALTEQVGGTLRVELSGTPSSARAELAVYAPTGGLAPGVSSGGAVFRQRVGDLELVTAAFASEGREARADVPDTSSVVHTAAYCRAAAPDVWIHEAGTEDAWRCSDLDPGNDPGATNHDYLHRPQAGDRTYGVYATRGEHGPRADGVDVTVGFGLYRQADPPREVLGAPAVSVLEADGVTWRLRDVLPPGPGGTFEVDTSAGDVYLGVAYAGVTGMSVTWRGAPEGGWGGIPDGSEPQGPGIFYPGRLLAGDHTVHVTVSGRGAQTRLLVYRPE